jgi:hypothetical protein
LISHLVWPIHLEVDSLEFEGLLLTQSEEEFFFARKGGAYLFTTPFSTHYIANTVPL